MAKVKFCGVTQTEEVVAINKIMPDYVGFVFWSKSKRAITFDQAAMLREKLDPWIKTVGVFVNADFSDIEGLFSKGIISVAQLHGEEDESYIVMMRAVIPLIQIWKAFVVSSAYDIQRAQMSSADLVVLDSGKGEGELSDWGLISQIHRPFVLAGGLNPDNVVEAIHQLHPYIVDVSSGIESVTRTQDEKAKKDPNKMRRFFNAALGI